MTGDPPAAPRQQYAALPCKAGEAGTQMLLVTSRETGRWVLPKGWPKKRQSGAAVAALEAFEEAGLKGDILPHAIGAYHYFKRMADGTQLACIVDVFPLRVVEILDDWPERAQRQRRWCGFAEAATLVAEAELATLLRHLATPGTPSPC